MTTHTRSRPDNIAAPLRSESATLTKPTLPHVRLEVKSCSCVAKVAASLRDALRVAEQHGYLRCRAEPLSCYNCPHRRKEQTDLDQPLRPPHSSFLDRSCRSLRLSHSSCRHARRCPPARRAALGRR